jgi:hypothetical protein
MTARRAGYLMKKPQLSCVFFISSAGRVRSR